MCYQAERVKNRKPTTLQMTTGHCFHADTTNKCFTIQPFTRTDTSHLPLFSKRCNVSLWDFRKPTAAFDNPAYCTTAMPQTKQCQTGINTGTHPPPPERPHTLNVQAIPAGATTHPKKDKRGSPARASPDGHCQHYHPCVTKFRG